MILRTLALSGMLGLAGSLPAAAVDTSMQLVLTLDGSAQRDVTTYQCEGIDDPVTVEYINAHPIFLAVLPVEDDTLIFVATVSASGVRYVSGQYVWHTSGAEAILIDEMAGEDAEPIDCISAADIP